ncbi:MAG: AMP-binding protein [Candidatus Rokuibacteriota bacterium]
MTLGQMLRRSALRRPGAEAVIDGRTRLTYAALDARTDALARGLGRARLAKGDRVIIVLKNRVEHVLVYWALQKMGGVPTPVNVRLSPGELRYVLEDSGARLVFCEDATALAVADAVRGRHVTLVHVGAGRPSGALPFDTLLAEGGLPEAEVAESDLSLILYTSGTTGRPKGVPRTHANHVSGALAQALQGRYDWGERTLGVMPLYHTMGIHSLTSMMVVNGCSC